MFTQLIPSIVAVILSNRKAERSNKTALAQSQLNAAYTPPVVDLGGKYSMLLKSIFVTFLYSGGAPILLPIAAGAFLIAFVAEKTLMLRFYSKPPAYDESLAKMTQQLVVWALGMHLAVTTWMYGDAKTSCSTHVVNSDLGNELGGNVQDDARAAIDQASWYDSWDLGGKLLRTSAFPVFLFLLFFIVYKV